MNTHLRVFLQDRQEIILELRLLGKVRAATEPRSIVGVSVLDEFVEVVISIGGKGGLMKVSQVERCSLPS
jgi:hypothetical protein